MNAVVMVSCAGAICYGIRGWFIAMWVQLIIAMVVAGATLFQETKVSK